MKAQDDNLTRSEAITLCIFLHSEKKRHAKDIEAIRVSLNQLIKEFRISDDERKRIKKKSNRYVKF